MIPINRKLEKYVKKEIQTEDDGMMVQSSPPPFPPQMAT